MLEAFFRQFGHPRGLLGALVGRLMAVKNGERSRWALGLLQAKPGERLLEVGFGPGVDVERLATATGQAGRVAGVDVSEVMLRQALARNRRAVAGGQVDLKQASASALPFADGSFDGVYSTNSAQFWPDLERGMRELLRALRAGGRAVVVVQPMWRGATEQDSARWRERLLSAMRTAGFRDVHAQSRRMGTVSAVAALAQRGA